jgi:hypothetical protein
MTYTIRRDYHAVHHSGLRPLSAIDFIVLHDMESTNPGGAAEGAGSWFENFASGGSTHYGVDNNSIQQYLALGVICWGAPGANTNGVHIEQMGAARWTRDQWMSKAKPTLERTAWLMARIHNRLLRANVRVPLTVLTDSEVRGHHHGVTTHRQLTRVLGGSHTDPGSGYPLEWVVKLARQYAA